MKSAKTSLVILILLQVLFLYGCLEDTDNTATTGMVRISVNADERTIVPNYPASFTRYVFSFTALDGQEAPANVEVLSAGSAEIELDLAWGRWRVYAVGYAALSGFDDIGFTQPD